jgi:hypothetical protein
MIRESLEKTRRQAAPVYMVERTPLAREALSAMLKLDAAFMERVRAGLECGAGAALQRASLVRASWAKASGESVTAHTVQWLGSTIAAGLWLAKVCTVKARTAKAYGESVTAHTVQWLGSTIAVGLWLAKVCTVKARTAKAYGVSATPLTMEASLEPMPIAQVLASTGKAADLPHSWMAMLK